MDKRGIGRHLTMVMETIKRWRDVHCREDDAIPGTFDALTYFPNGRLNSLVPIDSDTCCQHPRGSNSGAAPFSFSRRPMEITVEEDRK